MRIKYTLPSNIHVPVTFQNSTQTNSSFVNHSTVYCTDGSRQTEVGSTLNRQICQFARVCSDLRTYQPWSALNSRLLCQTIQWNYCCYKKSRYVLGRALKGEWAVSRSNILFVKIRDIPSFELEVPGWVKAWGYFDSPPGLRVLKHATRAEWKKVKHVSHAIRSNDWWLL